MRPWRGRACAEGCKRPVVRRVRRWHIGTRHPLPPALHPLTAGSGRRFCSRPGDDGGKRRKRPIDAMSWNRSADGGPLPRPSFILAAARRGRPVSHGKKHPDSTSGTYPPCGAPTRAESRPTPRRSGRMGDRERRQAAPISMRTAVSQQQGGNHVHRCGGRRPYFRACAPRACTLASVVDPMG